MINAISCVEGLIVPRTSQDKHLNIKFISNTSNVVSHMAPKIQPATLEVPTGALRPQSLQPIQQFAFVLSSKLVLLKAATFEGTDTMLRENLSLPVSAVESERA
jgi:hypothetical protein